MIGSSSREPCVKWHVESRARSSDGWVGNDHVVCVCVCVCVCGELGDRLSAGESWRHLGQVEWRRHKEWRSADDLQHSRLQLTHTAGHTPLTLHSPPQSLYTLYTTLILSINASSHRSPHLFQLNCTQLNRVHCSQPSVDAPFQSLHLSYGTHCHLIFNHLHPYLFSVHA